MFVLTPLPLFAILLVYAVLWQLAAPIRRRRARGAEARAAAMSELREHVRQQDRILASQRAADKASRRASPQGSLRSEG